MGAGEVAGSGGRATGGIIAAPLPALSGVALVVTAGGGGNGGAGAGPGGRGGPGGAGGSGGTG
ncbi:hypothetical protein [Micromonospora sp. NPDC049679]|uniref:hypothetical protein n=1 Tax=Micromonospora sp. NPDC049679 TaxID=3155920 RepID=UPI0033F96401